MLAIDRLLAEHSPRWYRTPRVQAAALGVVFFFTFAAYTTIQFYSRTIYGPDLAADSVSAVYLAFTLSCLVSPGVINKYGCRLSMLWGVLGYAALVAASMVYFLCGYGGEDVLWARRLVVAGGAVLGCGASLLWTAQGRLILQYASRAEELDATSSPKQNGGGAGSLMGLFWAIFQCSSLVGGFVSFLYYNQQPEGSTALYMLYLVFIMMGALSTQLLLPPPMLQNIPSNSAGSRNKRKDVEMITEQTPLTVDPGAEYARTESQNSDNGKNACEDLSSQSWLQEARGTVDMILTRRMLCLSLLFFYTGFNQPYQQATFGNRFFTRRTIGAELVIFHLMEIVGAIITGWFLDNQGQSNATNQRKRAIICLAAFVAINGAGNVLATMQEFAAKRNGHPTAHDIAELSVLSPSLAFGCWGFADAQIQVFCYWLMGGFFQSGSDHSRAVGWYKLVQSLGTSIGFYLIPTNRLLEMSQLLYSSVVFVVGTALAFSQLPSDSLSEK